MPADNSYVISSDYIDLLIYWPYSPQINCPMELDQNMKLIRPTKVIDYKCLARSPIGKYIAEGTFPKPVTLGSRAAAWVESEVQEWILERVEARDC